ncbi:hypothetical protein BDB01DRAFT_456242 [Pilobolus umbonatus]|nr:hypothetical protein BDB01DRAFT_456242 [Pilobolus umbonatus]
MINKYDQEFNDEQEDILMSYLNTDYISMAYTDDCVLSSSSEGSTPSTSPKPNYMDESASSSQIDDFHQPWVSNHESYVVDASHISCLQQNMVTCYPFIIPSSFLSAPDKYIKQEPPSPLSDLPPSPSLSSQSDSEHPKKKRGRKKREVLLANAISPSSVYVPSVKQLPSILPAKPAPVAVSNIHKTEGKEEVSSSPHELALNALKAANFAKRQERLIKNRAAALLSRKRKREHLNALEEERNGLVNENQFLKKKLMDMERINSELQNKLNRHDTSHTHGTLLMIILFSFVMFILPNAQTHVNGLPLLVSPR